MADGIKITRLHPRKVANYGQTLRDVPLKYGLPKVEVLVAELAEYTDILLGRVPAPIDHGIATLMEISNAYFARGCELDMLIHEGEREGDIFKGSDYYKFRTGELRSFLELTKRSFEMGSRLITVEQMRMNERLEQ